MNTCYREHKVGVCEELIYAGSSTTSGQPLLTPRPIQENIIQLQNMLKQLEQGIMEVVKDIDNKKKVEQIFFTIIYKLKVV